MSFTKSPTFWRNPVAIGISSPSGRGDTAPDNPLDNPLELPGAVYPNGTVHMVYVSGRMLYPVLT